MKVKCKYCRGYVWYDPTRTHNWFHKCDLCNTWFSKSEYLEMEKKMEIEKPVMEKSKSAHCSHADVFLFYDPLTDFRFKCVYCAERFTDLQMRGMIATGTVIHDENPKLHPETSRPKVKREITNPIGKEKEALAVVETFRLSFNLGNALLFLLSDCSGLQKISDLEKAIYYINREIEKT